MLIIETPINKHGIPTGIIGLANPSAPICGASIKKFSRGKKARIENRLVSK